ncbi:MAG: hypothetical protein WC242_02150 [Candidatus Paceibacterota bacterium]|jgi:hypothetical protein
MAQERTFRKIRIDKYTRDLLKKAGIEKASRFPLKVSQDQVDALKTTLEAILPKERSDFRFTTAEDSSGIYIVCLGPSGFTATQFLKIMSLNPGVDWKKMRVYSPFCRRPPFFAFACA